MRRVLKGIIPPSQKSPARGADPPSLGGALRREATGAPNASGRATGAPNASRLHKARVARRSHVERRLLSSKIKIGALCQQRHEGADQRAQAGHDCRAKSAVSAENPEQLELTARRQVRDVVLALDVRTQSTA